jgi:hypothetical protein
LYPASLKMLLLDHEIDLDGVVHTPGLAKVPRKTCATHRESVIEDNQLVAFSPFGGNIPAFQGNTVIGLEIDIPPPGHPIVVGSLEEHASEWPDDVGQVLDLCVVFFGNGFELFQRFFHSLFGYSAHDVF